MSSIQAGVKDESFETSLANSEVTVNEAIKLFRQSGWYCTHIDRIKGEEDYGDILIWKHNEHGQKYLFHTVDVKQNANWGDTSFPFRTVYVTSNDQLHPDWWYLVYNSTMTRYAFVDMETVALSVVEYDETTNRRGGIQQSAGIPIDLMKFRKAA